MTGNKWKSSQNIVLVRKDTNRYKITIELLSYRTKKKKSYVNLTLQITFGQILDFSDKESPNRRGRGESLGFRNPSYGIH